MSNVRGYVNIKLSHATAAQLAHRTVEYDAGFTLFPENTRLSYLGASSMPAEHISTIRSTPGLRVPDESPKMLLVDGDDSALRENLKDLPDWSTHPEREYPLPGTRKTLE
jgi:hypothetical protein